MGIEVAIGLAVASTVVGAVGSRKAGEQQEKAGFAAKASQAQAANEQRRQQVREARIRRARIVASSKASGTSGSSSESGSLNALQTSVGSNLAFSKSQEESVNAQSGFLQEAQDVSDDTALVGSIFNLAGSFVQK